MITRKPFALFLASLVALTTAGFAQTVKLSTATLTFSAQMMGTTSAAKNVTLTNTDNVTPLAIDGIFDSADYSETDTCGTSLAPLASCTIFVTFTPAGPGAIAGAITIQDEASNSPQVVSLTGTGVTPVSFSPATLAFGTVALGSKSSKPLTIINNQSVGATLQLTASGDYSTSAGAVNPCGANLPAKSSCTVTVTFQPKATGAINGALTIASNAKFSPADVPLTGSGGAGGKTPPLTFTPSSLSFGNVVVNTSSAGKVVTVKNVSGSGVTLTSFPASGNYVAKGSGASPCGGVLNAGSSCTMTVTFAPTVAGVVPGAVTVNDTGTVATQVFSLTGAGIQLVTLTPAALTFGVQNLGTASAAQIVTLTNHQTANTLAIDSISITGNFNTVTAGKQPCGNRLAALASCTIGVVFSPGAGNGAMKGALTVAYNATPSPGLVALNATATGTLMRFAYTANLDNTISSYTVDPATGRLRSNGYILEVSRPNAIVTTPSNAFVYTANLNNTGNVSGYAVSSSGALTPVPGSPFPAEPNSFAMTTDPSGKFLYVANADSNSNNISGYTINANTGALTPISGSPFQADVDTRAVVIDPTGKFLYAANASSNDVSAYSINSATGVLTQIAGTPFALPGGASIPQSMAIDPAGKFVFVGDTGSQDICVFSINSTTGALTVVTGSPFNTKQFAYSLAVHPSGKFIYAATSAGNVTALSIAGTGALAPLPISPFSVGTSTASVKIDQLGRFLYVGDGSGDVFLFNIDSSGSLSISQTILGRVLPFGGSGVIALVNGTAPVTYTPKFTYVANSDSNDISAYATDPESGTLTQIAGSPFKVNGPAASDPQAKSVAVDPTGKFAYSAEFNGNGSNGFVGAFKLNQLTGALTLTSGSPFTVGNRAQTAVVDPSGSFVYVTTPGSDSIFAFKIDRTTGNLIATLGGFHSNFSTSPWGAAIDPSGRYLCATMEVIEEVICFSIDPVSGSLKQVATGGAGPSAVSVAIDPSGRFVYVASTLIYAYTLSPAGILNAIPGSPFTAGGNPQSVAVDSSGRFLYTANRDSNDVTGFAIDQNTGALTNIPGSPFPAGQMPQAVSVDPSGSFVYVANSGDGDLSAFTIDPVSGTLTSNFSGPFATDSVPSFVAIVGTAH